MRRIFLLGLFALFAAFAANDACAQHHGGGGMSAPAGGGHGFGGARTATIGNGHGFNRGRSGSAHHFHHGYQGYGMGYGYLPGDFDYPYMPYDTGDVYPDEAEPVVPEHRGPQVVEATAPPVVEPPAHPVITEYKWPAASPSEPAFNTETAPQNFAIVLKNGSTVSAAVVFASSHWLHYVDPDEKHLRIALSEVDRAATLKINRARNLNLYLPAAQ